MLFNLIMENLKLTFPILMTRLLGMAGNIIAMVLMAKLGTDALSASALIMGIFSVCVLLVMSFSFSLCALVAEGVSSHNDDKIGNLIFSSLFLNTLLAIPFMVFFYYISPILVRLGQPQHIAYLVGLYFHGLILGYLPMIWASILEQVFVGFSQTRYLMKLSILSVVIMPLLSNIFMFGKLHLPALGMLGAGYAVSIMSIISFSYLLFVLIRNNWHKKYNLTTLRNKWDSHLIKKLYHLGWPIALQFSGEFLAYTFITIMMGWLGMIALAAQQIILQFTTIIVMIPTSLSQATAVLVAQANGRQDKKLIRYHVNIALGVIAVLMGFVAFIYLVIPETLISIYLETGKSQNKPILTLATSLLMIAAITQCFDGIKNVLSGAYRGLQETKIPMIIGTAMLWFISIPLAYFLGFNLHYGAIGLRWGFAIGIACGAFLLVLCWYSNLNLARLISLKFLRKSEIASSIASN